MAEDKKVKYLKIFRAEAEEHLKTIRGNLFSWEQNPGEEGLINSILRSAHTIKGSARMVGLEEIGQLAHRMEDLLKSVQSGRQKLAGSVINLLFQGVDLIENLMSQPGDTSQKELEELIENLSRAEKGEEISEPSAGMVVSKEDKKIVRETIRVESIKLDHLVNFASELVINHIKFENNFYQLKRLIENLAGVVQFYQRTNKNSDFGQKLSVVLEQFNQFYQDYYEDLIELEHNIAETQYQSLALRMFSLNVLFEEFPTYLRELAMELGKEIELKLEGGENELDKRVLEELRGPLIHLLRNACDHGIESPKQREKLGKPARGLIKITAFPKGSQMVIEVSDDGRGIDLTGIKNRAKELGYFQERSEELWTEDELVRLIFQPGFSTSKKVTELSGRGVGMDVVKTGIEKLGGDILVESKKGKGTTITLLVPLTLAIIRCILVMTEEVIYAIPINFVETNLRIKKEQVQTERGRPLIRFRDEMVPLYYLGEVLGYESKLGWPSQNGFFSILLLSHSQQRLAVVVERVLREEEVVTKAIGQFLAGFTKLVSGAIILRGGEPGLILNIFELFEEIRKWATRKVEIPSLVSAGKKIQVLVVDDSLSSRIVQKNILEQVGYRVDLAENSMEALEKIEKNDYDLFLVDIEMPGMDGFELTRRIRANPKTQRTPVVIVSTRGSDQDKKKGIEAGAQGYMVKSKFDPEGLLKMAQHLVGE